MEPDYKDFWEKLRAYFVDYNKKHSLGYITKVDEDGGYSVYGRYCVSISIDDLLEKMDEIEKMY